MKEIILINIGQAALEVANPSWQLFCLDHHIQPDGIMGTPPTPNTNNQYPEIFFLQTGSDRYVPRCINIDLEPSIIDGLRTGQHRQLFNPSTFMSGAEYIGPNNFAGGYYMQGQQLIERCLDCVRTQADDCHELQGFIITNSMVGGAGSGLGSLLLERLAIEYEKKTKINFSIYPSQKRSASSIITDPYDSVLSLSCLFEHSNASVVLDARSIQRICHRNIGLQSPNSLAMSRLTAQIVSSITETFRFDSLLNASLAEFQSNHVPYPSIVSLISSYAPILPANMVHGEIPSIKEMAECLFEPSNLLVQCSPQKGKYLTCTLTSRGSIIPKDIISCIRHLKTKKSLQFIDWGPAGIKAGMNKQPPINLPFADMKKGNKEFMMVSNNTAISEVFASLGQDFDKLYAKRAHLHDYSCGEMYESQFDSARERLISVEQDYAEIADVNYIEQG